MASQAVLELLVELKDQASSGLASLGGALKTVGGIAGGVALAGVAAFGAAVVSGIGDAQETAQLMAQTEAVIKSTGGAAGVSAQQVADLASSLSDAAGASVFGDDQIQAGENLLLTFTNIKETLPDATKIMVDMAQAMGTDVKGGAIQLGKALNDPIAGISALSRVGVTFTDAQKAQIKAMQDAGDTAGAQRVILAELNKEFGGSAAAAAAATGGWSELKGRLGEAAEAVGTALLPLLSQLAGFLLSTIVPAIETAAGAISAWLADPAVQAGIQAIGDAITTGLGAAFSWISQTAIPALIAGWALLQPAIVLVIGAFQQAAGAFQGTGDGAGVLGAIIAGLQARWEAVYGALQQIVPGILAVVTAVFGQIQVFLDAHGAEILKTLGTAWQQINTIINTIVTILGIVIGAGLQAIGGFIRDHGAQIQAVLSAAWALISSVISTTLGIISGVVTAALQLLQGNWRGAWQTIQTASATFVQGIYQVIVNGLNLIASFFGTSLSQIGQTWQNNWNMFLTIIGTVWGNIVSTVQTKVGEVVGYIQSLPGQVADVGSAIVSAIQDGFSNAWNSFMDEVNRKLQALRDTLPFSEPRDRSSPLFGLSKSGAAIVGMLQSGMDSAGNLQTPGLAFATAGVGGGAGAFGGGGSLTINVSISGGTGRERADAQSGVEAALLAIGARADARIRSGG